MGCRPTLVPPTSVYFLPAGVMTGYITLPPAQSPYQHVVLTTVDCIPTHCEPVPACFVLFLVRYLVSVSRE